MSFGQQIIRINTLSNQYLCLNKKEQRRNGDARETMKLAKEKGCVL